jgi:hypothetical protein
MGSFLVPAPRRPDRSGPRATRRDGGEEYRIRGEMESVFWNARAFLRDFRARMG